jgi:hypothetical protein
MAQPGGAGSPQAQIEELQTRLEAQATQMAQLHATIATLTDSLQQFTVQQQQRPQMPTEQQLTEAIASEVENRVKAALQAQQARNTSQGPPEPLVVPPYTVPLPNTVPPSPALQPTIPQDNLNSGLVKELSRKVYDFPENLRLTGPDNFDIWKQGLNIMFRAIGIPTFPSNPEGFIGGSDQTLALLLMLLRNSIGPGPQAAIAWQTDPVAAYRLLILRYSHSTGIQRDQLYRKFHELDFSKFSGSLADFNAEFSNLASRLTLNGVEIQPIDQVNHYLKAMEKAFPQWAERQRSQMRALRTVGQGVENLNLSFLIADLLEEHRIPASTTNKGMANRAYGENKGAKGPYKGPKKQGKKGPQSQQNTNGSSGNSGQNGQKKKKKKGQGSNSSSNHSTQPDSFACITGAYNITTGHYSDSSEDSSSESDSDTEELPSFFNTTYL